MGTELSPLNSTPRRHIRTPQHPELRSTINYLYNDTPFILSENEGIKS